MGRNNNNNTLPGAIIIEGHVQGLSNTRSLGETGIPVYVVDKNDCIAQHSKYCRNFFKCPDFIEDKFADFLIELAKAETIKDWVLIPSNDHAVFTISKHKDRLEQYYKVITPSLEIIEDIYDKLKLIEIAHKNNVFVPMTQNFKSVNDKISKNLHFPVLTKGRNGLSFYKAIGRKVFLAQNEAELRKQLYYIDQKFNISKTFIQELIPFDGSNKTISFTAFCIEGEIKSHWTGIKLREHPIRFGTATFTKSIYNEACHFQSIPLLKTLNYTGVCEIEYILDPRTSEYKLIEMNPRTWLWVDLAKASGVDYALMIYNYVNGKPIKNSLPDETPRYWRNPFTDFAYSILSIMKLELNPIRYLSSLFIKNTVNPLFFKGDMKPGVMYLLNILRYKNTR